MPGTDALQLIFTVIVGLVTAARWYWDSQITATLDVTSIQRDVKDLHRQLAELRAQLVELRAEVENLNDRAHKLANKFDTAVKEVRVEFERFVERFVDREIRHLRELMDTLRGGRA